MSQCVSCGEKNLLEKRIARYKLLYCRKCILLITQTNKADYEKYIREHYGKNYSDGYFQNFIKLQSRYQKYLSVIHNYCKQGKLLDVGCGTGYFLKYVQEINTSWQLFGVEPNSSLRQLAIQNAGVNIKKGSLIRTPFQNNYFEVVTCLDVLEHSIKLRENISELRRVLKPGGVLLIQAPNYKSIMAYLTGEKWDWWCLPDHVLHFSYKFLTEYMKKSGFTVLRSYTYEDPQDFLSNIKGLFGRNYFTKIVYYILLPFLLMIERFGWVFNMGGLTLLLVRKN